MKKVQTKKIVVQTQKPKQKANAISSGGRANKTTTAPAKYFTQIESYFNIRSKPSKHCRYAIVAEGQDFLGSVLAPGPSNDAIGKVLTEVYLNPQDIGISRLSAYAALYERYLFKRFKVKFVPSYGTAQNGSVVLAYDRDVTDVTPASGDAGFRQLMAFQGARADSVGQKFEIDCPLICPEIPLYTNPGLDDRLAYQGQVYVATAVPTGLTAGAVLGQIWIEYEVDLYIPQLENNDVKNYWSSALTVTAPDTSDLLKTYLNNPAPSANNVPLVTQKQADGTWRVLLPEGAYELIQRIQQVAAGGMTIGAPTLTMVEPSAAPAPQPGVKPLLGAATTTSTAYAFLQCILSVPKGGAWWTQAMSVASGTGMSVNNAMTLTRIGPYLSPSALANLYF